MNLTLYDRSRVTTDWTCPRRRYLQYELDGKGIVSGYNPLELYMGTILHDGLAAVAGQHQAGAVDIDTIASLAAKLMIDSLMSNAAGLEEEFQFAQEQAALVEGLLRGFYRHAWPLLMHAYPTIVHIEEEMRFDHDGLVFMSRPDLVVADLEGNLWYVEYKSTSSKKEGWINSWNTAIQLHSTIRAIESTTGNKVTGVLVQGLYKGFESYGKQSSPFCYAYHRYGNPPFSTAETIYEYRTGFRRVPTWEQPGGVKEWVDGMPPHVLADQFPQVPPIFVKDDMVDSFFQQRAYREHEISLANQMLAASESEAATAILDAAYPQKFESCHPYFGKACPYVRICHGRVATPLADGFEYRTPHHDLEVEQWKQIDSTALCPDSVSSPGKEVPAA